MTTSPTGPALQASYFDGENGRARRVTAWVADGSLHWADESQQVHDVDADLALWPDRHGPGQRQVLLPGGGVLTFAHAPAFDAWALATRGPPALLARCRASTWLSALATALLVGGLLVTWRWGVPAAAGLAARWLPDQVEIAIGRTSLEQLEGSWLLPSRFDEGSQDMVRQSFAAAVNAAQPATGPQPAYRILFRQGVGLGPNALALPDGTIVVTDELLWLLEDAPETRIAVLAHELGHIRYHHGTRVAAQAGAMAVVVGMVLGDFSYLLASAPALLLEAQYSRESEREADAYARDFLRGAGIDPRAMVVFFERAQGEDEEGSSLPLAFASHPADQERIAFFSRR